MNLFRNPVARRFSIIGRLADVLLLVSVGVRFAQRKGLITDSQATRAGFARVSDGDPIGATEVALALAATYRLLRRKRRCQKRIWSRNLLLLLLVPMRHLLPLR